MMISGQIFQAHLLHCIRIMNIVGLTINCMASHFHNHDCCGKFVEAVSILHVHCFPAWRWSKLWNDLEVCIVSDDVEEVGFLVREGSRCSKFLAHQVLDIFTMNYNDVEGIFFITSIGIPRLLLPDNNGS